MAVADIGAPVNLTLAARVREKIGFVGLAAALAAYTLFTLDGGDIAPRIVSAALLLVVASYFAAPLQERLALSLPVVCLFVMTCYGVAQTLWSLQKIVYNGWTGVLFWFTAASITLLSAQVFQDRQAAARFRFLFVI